jgi:YYY domain-containing protein
LLLRFVVVLYQREALAEFCKQSRSLFISNEAVFSLVFLLFLALRILNPDLWHPWLGGEKMLEIGFLNAIVKSTAMPPYDPFFAGGIINYYYYGLFIVGVLVKLTGIAPEIAFNLAIPTLAALTAVSVFSLVSNIYTGLKPSASLFTRASVGGLGVLFVLLLGNLEGAVQFIRNLGQLSHTQFSSAIPGVEAAVRAGGGLVRVLGGEVPATYNYWDPTRVIPETINEFPFFSFLFADLHPHMIGIPFTLLLLSLAYQWLFPAEDTVETENHDAPEDADLLDWLARLRAQLNLTWPGALRWLAIPFVLGSLAAINTWDLPTYLGVAVAAYMLARYRQRHAGMDLRLMGFTFLAGIGFAVAVLATAYIFYLPFFANYQAPAETGVGLVYSKTPLDLHLKIWGFFLFVLVSWLLVSLLARSTRHGLIRFGRLLLHRWNVAPHLWTLYRRLVKREGDFYQLGLWALIAVLFVSTGLFLFGYRVPAYLLPLVVLSLLLLFRREVGVAIAYLNLLVFTGLLILLGVEFVFLRDFLGGGDYYRMNTLFKFYIQVWVLFGVAAAVVLAELWDQAWKWALPTQVVWRSAVMILLVAGLVYPAFGTRTRVDDRFPGDANRPPLGTLDGLEYMTAGVFEWPAGNPITLSYDYDAIRWLQENVRGTPILAEAKIGYYREGGMRVAAYTGLPSILGGLHQNEQRPSIQVGRRDGSVNEFWTTTDATRAEQLVRQLGITFIYVGQIERVHYGENVAAKFEELVERGLLERVYENDQTTIYKVTPAIVQGVF